MNKADVIATLRQLADILEVTEANEFEVLSFRNGAQALDEWQGNLEATVESGELQTIPAVGKGLAQIIDQLVRTGNTPEVDRIRGLVPPELPALLRIRGLGPKRVRALWRELDVDSPQSLKEAAENGKVQALKGFGAKTVEKIIASLEYLSQEPRQEPILLASKVAVPQAPKVSGQIFAGISGYSYDSWRGSFYAVDCKSRDYLAEYSKRLSTVEINNTFYRFPTQKVIDAWAEKTPESFLFSVKANQRITHNLRLSAESAGTIVEFVERCGLLGQRLGCILFQLPPNLKFELARLDTLLSALPTGPRYALEVRNKSWICDEVFGKLCEQNVALVQGDLKEDRRTADFAYFRLPEEFTSDELDGWSKQFKDHSNANDDVFAYFKHDEEGVVPQLVERRWGICHD